MKKLRHIIEYIIFKIFMSFLRLFGVDYAANMCSYLARKIGPYLQYHKIAQKNLRNVYKNQDSDNQQIMEDLWDNFGRYVGEFPFINSLTKEQMQQRVTLTGLEHVKHLQAQKRPFLLFTAHQGNWDFLIRLINQIYPKFAIIYRRANNPYVDIDLLQERGHDPDIMMIPKGIDGSRNIVQAIKNRASIAMLIDQKMNEGIEVPFFDMPAMTAPAIARFSIKYNYPIIPAQIVRKGNTSHFEVIIHPAVEYETTGDLNKDCYDIMSQINKILERWIRQHPGQWFWFHNRWK